ncbi:MAG: ferric reductase [Actinomycetota bacterium]|nr:ferric reductase [Actinomycetota bacterium]
MTVWLTARGAGLAALVLLTMSTCLGALSTGRSSAPVRVVMQKVHRVLATLAIGVLALHVGTILADSYAHVGVRGAVVPFTSSYRATWVGLGTLGAYTFLGVAVLGMARGRLATSARAVRCWRAVHATAYLGWASAMLHGLNAGTDSSVPWVRLLYVACGAAVAGALAFRMAISVRRTGPGLLQVATR